MGMDLNTTRAYQYIRMNGPESIFQGYGWSLDVLVEYTWNQLGALSTLLIILLVVEVRFNVQIRYGSHTLSTPVQALDA
jgi:hypothetical protein